MRMNGPNSIDSMLPNVDLLTESGKIPLRNGSFVNFSLVPDKNNPMGLPVGSLENFDLQPGADISANNQRQILVL